MSRNVSLIGAGGHARACVALLRAAGCVVAHVWDEQVSSAQEKVLDLPIESLPNVLPEGELVLAIGDCHKRAALFAHFADKVGEPVVHPSAVIESSSHLEKGVLVGAGAFIGPEAQIGENTLINTHAVVEHESQVGKHSHISVGTILCGRVRVGDRCFIGAGAVVKDKVTICDDVTVGAGAVVVASITEPGIYVGCPARKIVRSQS